MLLFIVIIVFAVIIVIHRMNCYIYIFFFLSEASGRVSWSALPAWLPKCYYESGVISDGNVYACKFHVIFTFPGEQSQS